MDFDNLLRSMKVIGTAQIFSFYHSPSVCRQLIVLVSPDHHAFHAADAAIGALPGPSAAAAADATAPRATPSVTDAAQPIPATQNNVRVH